MLKSVTTDDSLTKAEMTSYSNVNVEQLLAMLEFLANPRRGGISRSEFRLMQKELKLTRQHLESIDRTLEKMSEALTGGNFNSDPGGGDESDESARAKVVVRVQ